MNAFTAVTLELWDFAVASRFDQGSKPASPRVSQALQRPKEAEVAAPRLIDNTSVTPIVPGHESFVVVPATNLYIFPTKTLDGVLSKLSLGTTLMVSQVKGQWAEVQTNELTGWVLVEDLGLQRSVVWPQLMAGIIYDSQHPQTKLIRLHINDCFSARDVDAPLQAIEYVLYRLQTSGRTIVWPATRPRIAGTWQKILKGELGVHIGVYPKTHAVMEVISADGTGGIWFVEAVFPDQAIRATTTTEEGMYTEKTIASQDWRELQPVFIEIS